MRVPISGFMCCSIQLRSPATDEALIGHRFLPSNRPAAASSRYQSQTSATVIPSLAERRSCDGSPPSITDASLFLARLRATSTDSTPNWPMTNCQVRRSALRYWMTKVFVPEGFRRTPKPRNSLSQRNASLPPFICNASTAVFVSFAISPLSADEPDPPWHLLAPAYLEDEILLPRAVAAWPGKQGGSSWPEIRGYQSATTAAHMST